MRQIALPLGEGGKGAARIVVGNANAEVVAALGRPGEWPFGAAVLIGPPRAGKSLLARWFAGSGAGEAIDDAHRADETALFHAWNRAQEARRPLLLIAGAPDWRPALPDLASRLGAAARLAIGAPDDAMLRDLIALHAETRGLALDDAALTYLASRGERSHMAAEALAEAIDRLSLERKAAPTLGLLRDALGEADGGGAPPLLPGR